MGHVWPAGHMFDTLGLDTVDHVFKDKNPILISAVLTLKHSPSEQIKVGSFIKLNENVLSTYRNKS